MFVEREHPSLVCSLFSALLWDAEAPLGPALHLHWPHPSPHHTRSLQVPPAALASKHANPVLNPRMRAHRCVFQISTTSALIPHTVNTWAPKRECNRKMLLQLRDSVRDCAGNHTAVQLMSGVRGPSGAWKRDGAAIGGGGRQ